MKKPRSRQADNRVIRKILSRIKKPVSFQYPAGETHKRGILVDRVVIRSNPGERGVSYWDVVDKIEFEGEKHPIWIRIGYYREKPKGRPKWGSQTTITEPIHRWKRLFTEAAKQKPWFRELLESVVSKPKK